MGTAQTVEFIIGAVLIPNREVKEGYLSHDILLKTGECHQAYILKEDRNELLIRDIARNREIRVQTATIKKRAQRGSVMPSGLTDKLTHDELRDLIGYLSTLGPVPTTGAVK